MKPELLLICGATPRMMKKMNAAFTIHMRSEISDFDAWVKTHGTKITAIAAGGHNSVDQRMLDMLPNLKIISCYGVGYDGIDANAAAERGIMVTHTPGVLSADVANLAILLMLATSRCLLRDDKWVRSGNWKTKGDAPLARSIENKKVGILGLGRIGGEIARKLEAFKCRISYHTRRKKNVAYTHHDNLVNMAGEVDYLICVAPGGASTRKLINRKVIDALGAEGTLINVGRGTVIDEKELVIALQEGRLGWAGLDVFDNEPDVPETLFDMQNVVLTPHIASATVETRQAMGDLTVENLIAFFESGKVKTPIPECSHFSQLQPA